MNILHKARKLESMLARTFDRAAHAWVKPGPREPLEILHAVMAAIEERLEPAGRGRQVFPFNKVKVIVAANSREARARLTAVLDGEPRLQDRIATLLREEGCDAPNIDVTTTYVTQRGPQWLAPEFHVVFDRAAAIDSAPIEAAAPPELKLTIVHGAADRSTYTLSGSRINLGRCAEVRDSLGRLIRTNHVAFADGTCAANGMVSRRHAHITYAAGSRAYRIVDDGSAQGTSIARGGRTVAVPSGSRGIRLQDGDEIVLGEARIRARMDDRRTIERR